MKTSQDNPPSISVLYLSAAMIFIATAIPIGFRQPQLTWVWEWPDSLMNIALYIPYGMALAEVGVTSLFFRAVVLSGLIETAQLFYVGRFSQPTDVLANVAGAYIGSGVGLLFRVPREMKLTSIASAIGLMGAIGWVAFASAISADLVPFWLGPTRLVSHFVTRTSRLEHFFGTVGVLATAGPVANTAFISLLISFALGRFLSQNNLVRNIGVAAVAALSATLLVSSRNPAIRPWCLVAAIMVSASFTTAATFGKST